MQRARRLAYVFVLLGVCAAPGADWRQFRGPGGLGTSAEKDLPLEWSAKKNLVWRTKLPGPGASSPVIVGNRVFVTCYTGYGLSEKDPGKMEDLRRHLLCVDRRDGNILWAKEFTPALPEHKYYGEGSYHGYSASTPASDGKRLYVFFGKSGVYCFDLDGKEIWHRTVGKRTDGWGSGASPLLYKDLLIVNASVESGSMVALNREDGNEVWKAPGINRAWNTPVLVTAPSGETELVVSIEDRLLGFDPDSGKELWRAEGVHRYVCPSVVAHDGVVYAVGGGHTSLAVKAGGRGDVTKTHVLWRVTKGSNVASPIIHDGHLYWAGDGGVVVCQDAGTGKTVYQERLDPPAGKLWASPVLADGKLYYVSQGSGTYVVAAAPKFRLLAHNTFEDGRSRANASVAVSDGQLFLRTDEYLYCIGHKQESVQLDTKTGTLHGTLDLPDGPGPFPVVVSIAGSGPTDRDGNQPGMKNDSLKLLGRGLAARGVAVLRYDRRGVGKSKAAWAKKEDEARIEMFADDAAEWVELLRKDPRFSAVGIIGHSEGALVGLLAARRVKIDAYVSLAGAGRAAPEVLREQLAKNLPKKLKEESDRIIDELVAGRTVEETPKELAALFRPSVQPYLIAYFKYDPAREIAGLDVPILIVQGTTDLQISVADAERLHAAQKKAELYVVQGMNHLLRHVKAPAEQTVAYFQTSMPIAPEVVEKVAGFLGKAMAKPR
jgi:outer membrane protein assembly factor BamB/pimeloyl-ACP methyl ester carboxylesterase